MDIQDIIGIALNLATAGAATTLVLLPGCGKKKKVSETDGASNKSETKGASDKMSDDKVDAKPADPNAGGAAKAPVMAGTHDPNYQTMAGIQNEFGADKAAGAAAPAAGGAAPAAGGGAKPAMAGKF